MTSQPTPIDPRASGWRSMVLGGTAAMAAVGLLLCLALLGAQWQTDVTVSGRGASAMATGTHWVSTLLPMILISGTFLLFATITPWRRNLGLALPVHRPAATAVRACVLAVWVLTVVGFLQQRSRVLFPQTIDPIPALAQAHHDLSTGSRALVSLRAGMQEETLDLVVPVTLAFVVILLTRVARRRPLHTGVLTQDRGVWLICVTAAAAGLVTRVLDHLYQGPIGAASAAVWGSGLLLIFAIYRSIWPLIVAHFLYDFVVVVLLPGHAVQRLVVVLSIGSVAMAGSSWLARRHERVATSNTSP